MMKLQNNKKLGIWLFAIFPLNLLAQHFRYQGLLDTVKQTGFYSIAITPDLSAHLKTDFSDLRIRDDKGRQVPYLLRSRKPQWQERLFQPFPIIEYILDDSGRSVMVIQKNVAYPIANLSFMIKNASVSRYASLSGSNDGKKWFIISEKILINERYETVSDSSIQSIRFPASSYAWFKLVINNGQSDPLNINRVGYYPDTEYKSIDPSIENPQPVFVQNDSSNGITYIRIVQQQPFRVDELRFETDGPKYFSRSAMVLLAEKDRRQQPYWQEISRFPVSSATPLQTAFPTIREKTFYLAIQNGDNPPLKITAVKTYQEYHELVAWLEAGKPYKLVMDAADAAAPHYDLQQFQDSIPATASPLVLKTITPLSSATIKADTDSFPRKWIWLIMAGVVLLLAWLTWKLTSDLKGGGITD